MNRRQFLRRTGLAAGAGMAHSLAAQDARQVSIVLDATDPIASEASVKWAAGELEQALVTHGVRVQRHASFDRATAGVSCVWVAGSATGSARPFRADISVPEAFVLAPVKINDRAFTFASASDARGLVYATLELADRVRHASDPLAALDVGSARVERPANPIRSVARCFVSDVEDKPWYNDRPMWPPYLSMLATQRFNRFSLTLGIGYDFPRDIRDCYFHFAYPFLVSAPGYRVRAVGLPDAERDRNLEMLRFISDETAARGLEFQLGLWTHAYEWTDSPNANYTFSGLTPENHAAYCRDALGKLLAACPAISGVTFRVHGESGVAEGSYEFWKTVFDGVVRSGRRIRIDMHAKGMDDKMIEVALATGMPVTISPKYWAEHMGLPYHQAAIRELEMPRQAEGFFALSSGSRRFLRYGYGDLLREDRRYGILHRIWPGTQRVLLWGDPAIAAGYGRASSFCGSDGVEICEPLSFKGRKGSGLAGGRCVYKDASWNPKCDWEKYLYTYRVWGQLLYNPDAAPDTWRRYLRKEFKAEAAAAETALASASRILPLFTTAHGASGANNTYWPEVYTNQPIVDPERPHPYRDTPSPRRFGTVSPFDPQLFSRVDDFAEELLEGKRSGKYSPLEVAQWLEDFAATATKNLPPNRNRQGADSAESRRWAVDISIQSGLGRFFAHKLRAAVLWSLYDRSRNRAALDEALKAYRAARAAWAELAERAQGVYAGDITYGMIANLRGHWLDRLPAIDADIADMEKRRTPSRDRQGAVDPERLREAIRQVLARPKRPAIAARHTPARRFRPAEPLAIELSLERGNERKVTLHYRHVNQSELWRAEEMPWRDNRYQSIIPGEYTRSPYPLQYYFELHEGPQAWLYPGFEPTLSNQPYFVVRQG